MKKLQVQKLARILAAVAVAGLVGAPVAASAATSSSTVRANVSSVISVSSGPTVAINITPTSGAGAEAEANDTVTVDSNDGDGYDLTLSNSDTTLTLTGYKDDNTTTNGSTLAAASGTYGSPAALGSNAWGYRVDGLGSFGAGGTTTYAAVPSSAAAQNIKSTTATANAEATTVKYAAKVNLSVPDGIYRDTVTYTATAK
jgi:hypothetical protein